MKGKDRVAKATGHEPRAKLRIWDGSTKQRQTLLSSCRVLLFSLFFFSDTEDTINLPRLTVTKPEFPSEQQLPFNLCAKPLRCCPTVLQQEHPHWHCSQNISCSSQHQDTARGFASARAAFQPDSGSHPSTFILLFFFFFATGVINN